MSSLGGCAWRGEPWAKYMSSSQNLNFLHDDYPAADVNNKSSCAQYVGNQHMEEHTKENTLPGGSIPDTHFHRKPKGPFSFLPHLMGPFLVCEMEPELFCVYG